MLVPSVCVTVSRLPPVFLNRLQIVARTGKQKRPSCDSMKVCRSDWAFEHCSLSSQWLNLDTLQVTGPA